MTEIKETIEFIDICVSHISDNDVKELLEIYEKDCQVSEEKTKNFEDAKEGLELLIIEQKKNGKDIENKDNQNFLAKNFIYHLMYVRFNEFLSEKDKNKKREYHKDLLNLSKKHETYNKIFIELSCQAQIQYNKKFVQNFFRDEIKNI